MSNKHVEARCDVCGEVTLVAKNRFKRLKGETQSDSPGVPCRMTPKCLGRHRLWSQQQLPFGDPRS